MINLDSKKALKYAFLILFISIIVYAPRIYLRNTNYYISKDINRLYAHYFSLQEENRFLSQQLEDMKFKNQIIDSLLFNPLNLQKNQKEEK